MAIDITAGGYDLTPYISEIYTEKSISGDSPIGNAISEKLTLEIDSRRMTTDEKVAAKTKNYTYNGKTFYLYSCPQRWTGVTTLELYDNMANLFNKKYSFNKGTKISTILSQCCGTYAGVSSTDANYYVTGVKKSKRKAREWIAWIAEILGANVFIGSGDIVTFRTIGKVNHSLDIVYNYELIEHKELGKVIYKKGDDEESTGGGSPIELSSDNPFTNEVELLKSTLMYNDFWTANSIKAIEPNEEIEVGDYVNYNGVKDGTDNSNILCTSVKHTPGYGKAKGIVELSSDIPLDSQVNNGTNSSSDKDRADDLDKIRDDYNNGDLGGSSGGTGGSGGTSSKMSGDEIINAVNENASDGKQFSYKHLEIASIYGNDYVKVQKGELQFGLASGSTFSTPFQVYAFAGAGANNSKLAIEVPEAIKPSYQKESFIEDTKKRVVTINSVGSIQVYGSASFKNVVRIGRNLLSSCGEIYGPLVGLTATVVIPNGSATILKPSDNYTRVNESDRYLELEFINGILVRIGSVYYGEDEIQQ